MSAVASEVIQPLKIDIGCGKNKREGFIGADGIKFDGVDVVHSFSAKAYENPNCKWSPLWKCDPWPWETSSVDEIHCSHFLEHLTNLGGKFERVQFFNEAWRVLKPKGKLTLITPHPFSIRYYGDPTHCEAFSEFAFYYLDKNWRASNAPHDDSLYVPGMYNCDLECVWGFSINPILSTRNAEYQQHAQQFWVEAKQDMHATITARK